MIIGVLVLVAFPILGVIYAIIGLWKNPSNWKRFLPFLIYGFFVGAYALVPPDDGFDLVRYLAMPEEHAQLSFFEALTKDGDILYVSHIFFWLCGRINLPHLVPAITTAAVYASAFYITCDTAERYEKQCFIGPIILFQASMMPYIMIINNVRNVFGLAMVALAIYLELVKKRKKWYVYVLYIIGATFHLSAFILIVFRIIAKISKKIFGIIMLMPLLFTSIIYFLNEHISNLPLSGALGNSIKGIVWRLYGYLTYRDLEYAVLSLNSKTVLIDRIVMFIGMGLSIMTIYYFLRFGKRHIKDDARIYCIIGMLAVMTVASNVFAMPNFWRFAAAFYVVSGIVAVPLLAAYRRMPLIIKFEPYVFSIVGAFCLMFQYIRYNSVFLLEWLSSGAITNIFTIAFDFFKGI